MGVGQAHFGWQYPVLAAPGWVFRASSASVERKTIFRIPGWVLAVNDGVNLVFIFQDAIPENQYILKIMEKQEDQRYLKKFICIMNPKS